MSLNKLTKGEIIKRIEDLIHALRDNPAMQELVYDAMNADITYVPPVFTGYIKAPIPAGAQAVRWNASEETLEFQFRDLGPAYWVAPAIGEQTQSDVG